MAKNPIEKQEVKVKPPTYKSLMASKGIDKLSTKFALLKIGLLIDACDLPRRSAGIARALEWCDALEARGLAAVEQTELDYFRANAWDLATNTSTPQFGNGNNPLCKKRFFVCAALGLGTASSTCTKSDSARFSPI